MIRKSFGAVTGLLFLTTLPSGLRSEEVLSGWVTELRAPPLSPKKKAFEHKHSHEKASLKKGHLETARFDTVVVPKTPVDKTPVDMTPVDMAPVDMAPVDKTPMENASIDKAAVEKSPPPAPPQKDHALDGIASYYWQDLYTASGEIFDKKAMTAAHPTLPFGTMVEVTNLGNGRSAVVRINDRGPFIRGRVIDVSEAAADALGMRLTGLAPVRINVMTASAEKQLQTESGTESAERAPSSEQK